MLSKAGSETVRRAVTEPLALRRSRANASAAIRTRHRPDAAPDGDPAALAESVSTDPTRGNGSSQPETAEPRRKMVRRTRKTKEGLPEGWVVDEDGYVVPRHD